MKVQVAIVGAGMSGLCCARVLAEKGVDCVVLEASDEVGGRVRTDFVDGFQLDRGFQVLLTAYPEAQRVLDYPKLQLRPFLPGAMIRFGGRFHTLADPFRKPSDAIGSIFSPIGTLADKLRVGWLRAKLLSRPNRTLHDPEKTTIEALKREGFSDSIIERFFRPFLGGVFLEPELETSSAFFEFVFRMFSSGDIAVPAAGMGALPKQIATGLPDGCVRLRCRATGAKPGRVELESGEVVAADVVVLATAGADRQRLVGKGTVGGWRSTTCLYFSSPNPPVTQPMLVLNGEGDGPVNNLVVLSQVAPEYSRSGAALTSVSVVGKFRSSDEELENDVRRQLGEWFGQQVQQWSLLRTYRISHALPALTPNTKPVEDVQPFVVCGDDQETPSLQGAILSGRKSAVQVLSLLGR